MRERANREPVCFANLCCCTVFFLMHCSAGTSAHTDNFGERVGMRERRRVSAYIIRSSQSRFRTNARTHSFACAHHAYVHTTAQRKQHTHRRGLRDTVFLAGHADVLGTVVPTQTTQLRGKLLGEATEAPRPPNQQQLQRVLSSTVLTCCLRSARPRFLPSN